MGDQGGPGIIVKMPRHFSGKAVTDLVAEVRQTVRDGEKRLTFDFSGTGTVDSFGIGQLVFLAKEFRDSGVRLTLRGFTEDVFHLFAMTGLDQVFTIEGVKQEAIDLFASTVDVRLHISFEEVGDVCIVHLSGVMDNVGGARFFKQKFLLSMSRFQRILLDFSELTLLDSLCVSVLLDMHKLLTETSGQMRICGANYIIEELFSTLNLNAVIPIFHTREQAFDGWK